MLFVNSKIFQKKIAKKLYPRPSSFPFPDGPNNSKSVKLIYFISRVFWPLYAMCATLNFNFTKFLCFSEKESEEIISAAKLISFSGWPKHFNVFVNKTIHEILWGYEHPLLEANCEKTKKEDYEGFPFCKFGIHINKNDSVPGIYTVKTGENKYPKNFFS